MSFYSSKTVKGILNQNPIIQNDKPKENATQIDAEMINFENDGSEKFLRDRALIYILLDLNINVSMLSRIKVGNLIITDNSIMIKIGDSIYKPRRKVQIYLLEWLQFLSQQNDSMMKSTPLWISFAPSRRNKALTSQGIRCILDDRVKTTVPYMSREDFEQALKK
jgi:hypothetical protein